MPRTNNEMIAAKLPYQHLRCFKLCKRFQYNWRKKRAEYRRETERSKFPQLCGANARTITLGGWF